VTRLEIDLLSALREMLASDGHDRDCAWRKNKDKPCSLRCLKARKAVEAAQKQLLLSQDCSDTTSRVRYLADVALQSPPVITVTEIEELARGVKLILP
jgi:hypothetical protein